MERDKLNYEDHPFDDAKPDPRQPHHAPIPVGGLYQRERRFVDALLEVLQGRPLTDDVLLEAAEHSLRTKAKTEPKRTRELLAKAKMIMNFPNVRAHLLDLFQRAADFTPEEAAQAHVKHIREGNFTALMAYWNLTLQKEPRQVEMKAAVMNVSPEAFDRARAPKPIAARVLGEMLGDEATPPIADDEAPEG